MPMNYHIQFIMSKKLILFIILFIPSIVFSLSKDNVILSKCIDGDTARIIVNNEEVKVRFIGIDSPESAIPNEEPEKYGVEASNYTCKKLKSAKKIVLEYEDKSDRKDKYGRTLAYVFVDDKLLQELIVKNGYAKVKYINEDYKYYIKLINAEEKAKTNKKGIYSEENNDNYIIKFAKKIFSNILKEIFN